MSFKLSGLGLPGLNATRGRPTVFDVHNEVLAYASGSNVVVCTPNRTFTFTDHKVNVTCVKIAPSGSYACSGDSAGNINVFDLLGEENVTILSKQVLSNVIYDLAWDFENQRIIAVGHGKEEFATVFIVKTGASIGSISGHQASILSCDFRQKRPFRIFTGGEDGLANIFKGPPFAFLNQHSHGSFVNCVRFDPTSTVVAATGSNKQLSVLDGATGEQLKSFTLTHSSPIYSLVWESYDTSTKNGYIWTGSSDRTVRRFHFSLEGDVSETHCFTMHSDEITPTTDEQVLGLSKDGNDVFIANLAGDLFKINSMSFEKERILSGHRSSVLSIASDGNTIASSSMDGSIMVWRLFDEGIKSLGRVAPLSTARVTAVNLAEGKLSFAGHDSELKSLIVPDLEYDYLIDSSDLIVNSTAPSAVEDARWLSSGPMIYLIDQTLFYHSENFTQEVTVNGGRKLAINHNESLVAVGTKTGKVTLFDIKDDVLNEVGMVAMPGEITCLSFSRDNLLAVGDATRKIYVFEHTEGDWKCRNNQFVFHSGRVNCLDFSPCGQFIVSGGLDGALFKWSLQQPMKRVKLNQVHKLGITSVLYLKDDVVVSGGADGFLKVFNL
ncbi:hypothetical protein P9112_002314 [Eukaryota sp. TZLM1-RC]